MQKLKAFIPLGVKKRVKFLVYERVDFMPKRGENIRKRKDGRWEARILTSDGKHQSIYAKTYLEVKQKVKNNAEIKKQEIEEKQNNLEIIDTPFTILCGQWLKETEIKNKKSTTAKYSKTIQKHIMPYFQSTDITKDNVNSFILDKLNEEKLQEKTVYDIVTVLLQIIKYGENQGYIHNFRHDITRPTVTKKELEILTETEQERLVNSIRTNITHENIGILLSLYSGMRLGEICALQWGDIDIQAGTISITKAMQRIAVTDIQSDIKTIVIIDTPKSQKSIRTIPIPEFLKAELIRLSKHCTPETYVLTASENKYIEPRLYQYKFKKYLKQAGIRNINFHALRHTFATRAVEQNIDIKALSEILGHATVNFTLERYVHISFNFKKQNIEKLKVCY